MKKTILIVTAISFGLLASGQESFNVFQDRAFMSDFLKTVSILLLLGLIAAFIINMIKMILDYRLKNKMIDKGISEQLAGQFLKAGSGKNEVIKWFAIFCGIGVGLILISLFPPFGIHSLIIMVFSIAISFWAYYFFVNRSEK